MQKRNLGNTGIQVSEIAFGGVEIGMPYGIGVNGMEDMLTEKEAVDLLHVAVEKEFNFFDTARMYGLSEERMGKAFKNYRNRVVIASKCRHFRTADNILPPDTAIKKIIHTSIRESLQALQTDFIDLYMLHQADTEILERQVIMEEMVRLKEAGVVRAIGVSVYTTEETRKAIASGIWNVVQLPFNLMDQRQQALFDMATAAGVGIVIRSVLMKGLLSERNIALHEKLVHVEKHIRQYLGFLDGSFTSLPELAVKFALSFPQVSSVLIGIDKPDYLEQSRAAADGRYLNAEQLKKAQSFAYPEPEFLNLVHWNKMGWLK